MLTLVSVLNTNGLGGLDHRWVLCLNIKIRTLQLRALVGSSTQRREIEIITIRYYIYFGVMD